MTIEFKEKILHNLFNEWKDIKHEEEHIHTHNIVAHNIIKKNVNKVVNYYNSLSEVEKEKLKNNKPIQYLFWEAYKNKLISFEVFLKLNKQEESGSDKDYMKRQYNLLKNLVDNEEVLSSLIENYPSEKEMINYYFNSNKDFYSTLINPQISNIVDLMYETFHSTNSEKLSQGGGKKIINRGNYLNDIFNYFNLIVENNFKDIIILKDEIKYLGDSIALEILGLYHLDKENNFIYNKRIELCLYEISNLPYKYKFKVFSEYYLKLRYKYKKHFKIDNDYLKLNLELDSFIFWLTKNRLEVIRINNDIYEIKKNAKILPADKKIITDSIVRLMQPKFRKALLKEFKKCPITNINQNELLIASHIKPWRYCDNEKKKKNPNNGLLLSSNIDKLFDIGLISFTSEGKMIISKKLNKECISLLDLNSNYIYDLKLNEERIKFLKYHEDIILKK